MPNKASRILEALSGVANANLDYQSKLFGLHRQNEQDRFDRGLKLYNLHNSMQDQAMQEARNQRDIEASKLDMLVKQQELAYKTLQTQEATNKAAEADRVARLPHDVYMKEQEQKAQDEARLKAIQKQTEDAILIPFHNQLNAQEANKALQRFPNLQLNSFSDNGFGLTPPSASALSSADKAAQQQNDLTIQEKLSGILQGAHQDRIGKISNALGADAGWLGRLWGDKRSGAIKDATGLTEDQIKAQLVSNKWLGKDEDLAAASPDDVADLVTPDWEKELSNTLTGAKTEGKLADRLAQLRGRNDLPQNVRVLLDQYFGTNPSTPSASTSAGSPDGAAPPKVSALEDVNIDAIPQDLRVTIRGTRTATGEEYSYDADPKSALTELDSNVALYKRLMVCVGAK